MGEITGMPGIAETEEAMVRTKAQGAPRCAGQLRNLLKKEQTLLGAGRPDVKISKGEYFPFIAMKT